MVAALDHKGSNHGPISEQLQGDVGNGPHAARSALSSSLAAQAANRELCDVGESGLVHEVARRCP
jgi:hypothetical protein